MRTEADLLRNLSSLNAIEIRTLNRYYLHPRGQRCCSKCLKIYDNYPEHFHIKKYQNNVPSYNVHCAGCFSSKNKARIAAYRKQPHVFIKSKLSSYLSRARSVKCPFDLTAEYLIHLWEAQQGKCFYTDQEISFEYVGESGKAPHLLTPSLDRLDPEKGYTKGNVVWCAYGINRMKNDLTYEDFIFGCEHILKTRNHHDQQITHLHRNRLKAIA